MRRDELADVECAIAQAAAVVGEWWTLLIIRDVVSGVNRFDELQAELGISRKVLSERLASLVSNGVLEKRIYQAHPPRHEYQLSRMGEGLLPVLIALQDWGSRHVLGDGTLTATTTPRSIEARRLRRLVGARVPAIRLRDGADGDSDPVFGGKWTVIYCYPGGYAASSQYPVGWSEIPGAAGCTVESTTFRDHIAEFDRRGARVVGISTQRPEDQVAFAAKMRLPFQLLSDQNLQFAAALRLPTFRAAGGNWLKRLTLVVGSDRKIRQVFYPVQDPAASVGEVLAALDKLNSRQPAEADVAQARPA
jgi:DNA-binding HxlR family transcriptional regulator/peroxiredoxin